MLVVSGDIMGSSVNTPASEAGVMLTMPSDSAGSTCISSGSTG
jgi:hypothetical protein